jgi:folate-dependent phosphoribosylglycinamide formyltransferase PurN
MSIDTISVLIGDNPAAWFIKALQHMEAGGPFEISLVVDARAQTKQGNPPGEQSLARQVLVKNPIVQAGKSYFLESPLTFVPLDEIGMFHDVPRVETEPIAETDYRVSLAHNVVDKISRESDVVIQYGMGILTGDILQAPSYGVVSYHHGDIREYRGGPPGFWEFLHGKEQVGITVQRLTEELDGGDILLTKHVDIEQAESWPAVRQRMVDASPPLLIRALQRLADNAFSPDPPDKLGPIYRAEERGLKEYCMVIYRTLIK